MTAIWAHRGASAYAPENTVPAIEMAIGQGIDGVEFDVQRSADGHVVLIHDDNISRTSNGFGRVADLTLEQMRHCNFSNGFVGFRKVNIPTLEEALEVLKPTNLTINVELKNSIELYPGLENDVYRIVKDADLLDQVIFSSFNHFSLANLRGRVGPEQLGLLITDGIYDPWRYAAQFGAGWIHPHKQLLRHPNFMWLCHEAGVKASVWTVDDPSEFHQLESQGVDAVVTNSPDQMRRFPR